MNFNFFLFGILLSDINNTISFFEILLIESKKISPHGINHLIKKDQTFLSGCSHYFLFLFLVFTFFALNVIYI